MKTRFKALLAATALLWAPAFAESADELSTPVVVELFTSQSCSSCVPASKLMTELAGRDRVIALGWHVDYWNMLNTRKGRWIDPYSNAASTARQKKYNENIRRRRSVYTPQLVIAGERECVGSDIQQVQAILEEEAKAANASAIASARNGGVIKFSVSANPGGNAYLVIFNKSSNTKVGAGENAGIEFQEVNVVTDMKPLGAVRKIGAEYSVTPPEGESGCALLLQAPGQGRIFDASYCPDG